MQYTTGSFFGEDRSGHPVFYDFLGNLDIKGSLIIVETTVLQWILRITGMHVGTSHFVFYREVGLFQEVENVLLVWEREYLGP